MSATFAQPAPETDHLRDAARERGRRGSCAIVAIASSDARRDPRRHSEPAVRVTETVPPSPVRSLVVSSYGRILRCALLEAGPAVEGARRVVRIDPRRPPPRAARARAGAVRVPASDTIRPGDVVLDVGAFVGIYAVLAARWSGPDGRVDRVRADAVERRAGAPAPRLQRRGAASGSSSSRPPCRIARRAATLHRVRRARDALRQQPGPGGRHRRAAPSPATSPSSPSTTSAAS